MLPPTKPGAIGAQTECPHKVGTYPKLPANLADLVRKYETCELTEAEAAAEAYEYHENKILVRIEPTNEQEGIRLLKWMDDQSIQPNAEVEGEQGISHIYAFVQVSKLGEVAKRTDVEDIYNKVSPLDKGEEPYLPRPFTPQPPPMVRGVPQPTFPGWIDDLPHPGRYPLIPSYGLTQMARAYDLEGFVNEELIAEVGLECIVQGQAVWVDLHVETVSGDLTTLTQWLNSHGGSRRTNDYRRALT